MPARTPMKTAAATGRVHLSQRFQGKREDFSGASSAVAGTEGFESFVTHEMIPRMSDENVPEKPQDNPFEPAEPQSPFADETPTGPSSGCSTPLLIGCGVGLVLVGILLVVTLVNIPAIMGWVFESTGSMLAQELPEEIPAEERQRLEQAFRDVAQAAREERIDPDRLMELQREIRDLQGKDPQDLTREDVRELTEALEGAVEPRPAEEESESGAGDGGG